jgi:hypothetical protein
MLVSLAKFLLILLGFALYIPYRLWIAGGAIADRRERRRVIEGRLVSRDFPNQRMKQ